MPEDDIHSLAKAIAVLQTESVGLHTQIETRDAALQKALELQAKEYERRLEQLNGERAREHEQAATWINREIFDAYRASIDVRFDEFNKWRNELMVDISSLKGRVTGSVFILAAAWTVAQAVISWWRTH